MVDALVVAAAVGLWAATLVQAARSRVAAGPADRALLLAYISLALGATVFIPGVQDYAERVTGIRGFADPVARTAVLCGAWSAQALLLHVTRGQEARRSVRLRGGLVLGVVAAVWALFLANAEAPSVVRPDGSPYAPLGTVAYLPVFLGYLGYALVDIARGAAGTPLSQGRPWPPVSA